MASASGSSSPKPTASASTATSPDAPPPPSVAPAPPVWLFTAGGTIGLVGQYTLCVYDNLTWKILDGTGCKGFTAKLVVHSLQQTWSKPKWRKDCEKDAEYALRYILSNPECAREKEMILVPPPPPALSRENDAKHATPTTESAGSKRKNTGPISDHKADESLSARVSSLNSNLATLASFLDPSEEDRLSELRWCIVCEQSQDPKLRKLGCDGPEESCAPEGGMFPPERPPSMGEDLVRLLTRMKKERENAMKYYHGVLCGVIQPLNAARAYIGWRDTDVALGQGMFAVDGIPFVATEKDYAKFIHYKRYCPCEFGASDRFPYQVKASRIDLSTPLKDTIAGILRNVDVKKMFGVKLRAELKDMQLHPPGRDFLPSLDMLPLGAPGALGTMVLEFCYTKRDGGALLIPCTSADAAFTKAQSNVFISDEADEKGAASVPAAAIASASASAPVSGTAKSFIVRRAPYAHNSIVATVRYGQVSSLVTPMTGGHRLSLFFFLAPLSEGDEKSHASHAAVHSKVSDPVVVVDQKDIDALVMTDQKQHLLQSRHLTFGPIRPSEYSTMHRTLYENTKVFHVLSPNDTDEKVLRDMNSPMLKRYLHISQIESIVEELDRRIQAEGSIGIVMNHECAEKEIQRLSASNVPIVELLRFTSTSNIPIVGLLRNVNAFQRGLIMVPVVIRAIHNKYEAGHTAKREPSHQVYSLLPRSSKDRAMFKFMEENGSPLSAFGWWGDTGGRIIHKHTLAIDSDAEEEENEDPLPFMGAEYSIYAASAFILVSDALYSKFLASRETDSSSAAAVADQPNPAKRSKPTPASASASASSSS